jgi:hypothetical protein
MTWMRRLAAGAVIVGAALHVAARQEAAPVSTQPYQRVVADDEAGVMKLEMAVREFAPPKEGQPRVFLAGAVHIGDASFYKSLQEFLDQQDVVLFEGVKPPGAGAAEHDAGGAAAETDESRAAATTRRVRFIAMAVEKYRSDHEGKLPRDLEELVSGSQARIASLVKGSLTDAWGHALVYTVLAADADGEKSAGFDVVSLGSDGAPGGEGAAADLRFSDQKPLSKPETGDRSEGIQQKLADALGLVFQLSAMNNNAPNWRNSDLSVDQVQARLEKAGANADGLFKLLDGSSMLGRIAGLAIGFLGSSPDSRAMLKVMMIETLAHADVAMKAPGMGKMGAVMGVIVEDRNAVVLADLKGIIEGEPSVKNVAIIYGAGHLPTMEQRLVGEMGYKPVGDTWRAAMRVDATEAGLKPAQVRQMREMIDRMFAAQAKGAAKAKDEAPGGS